ncbi:putative Polcalcin Jun o [Tripterygium wilfordii]|uniref:Putative Polcalcin Jun o n=1 Tax=Tripterygium wilfordii TaxID=458696 RepID=A0A7J7CUT7_TRIWF|nr:probable calcium-binding protein CML25 [Tripterygium wilfordii]KAF5737768.1 putative Polcalcin Jun o [Tripterygium wilfordii]
MGFGALFHRKKKGTNSTSSSNHESPNGSLSPTTREPRQKSHIDEIEVVFRKFDVNGDGKISSAELGSIMSSLGQSATEEELQKMIKEIDADGDGYIDFNEFVELNTKGIDNDEALENLKDAFAVYDIDGNGSITAEELHKVMSRLGDECSIAECRKMISGVDSDGDGMIDFEEFKVMMMMGARYDSLESQRLAVKE